MRPGWGWGWARLPQASSPPGGSVFPPSPMLLLLSLVTRGVCPRGFSRLVAHVFLGVGVQSAPGWAGPRLAGRGPERCGLPAGRASTGRARGTTPRSTRGSRSAARRSGRCSACCWWRSPAACSPCCCTRRNVGKEGGVWGPGRRLGAGPRLPLLQQPQLELLRLWPLCRVKLPAVTAPVSELSGHVARCPVGLSLTPPCSQDMAHCTCPHMS